MRYMDDKMNSYVLLVRRYSFNNPEFIVKYILGFFWRQCVYIALEWAIKFDGIAMSPFLTTQSNFMIWRLFFSFVWIHRKRKTGRDFVWEIRRLISSFAMGFSWTCRCWRRRSVIGSWKITNTFWWLNCSPLSSLTTRHKSSGRFLP